MRLYVRHPDGYGEAKEEQVDIQYQLLLRGLGEHSMTLLHDGHAKTAVEIATELGWGIAEGGNGKPWHIGRWGTQPDHALVFILRSFDPDSGFPDDRDECEERARRLWRSGIPVSVVPV